MESIKAKFGRVELAANALCLAIEEVRKEIDLQDRFMLYPKDRPIYQGNENTEEGDDPKGGGLATDYRNRPGINPDNLEEGGQMIETGIWTYPNGVRLPLEFWDSPRTYDEPFGGYGWQHWDQSPYSRWHRGTDHVAVLGQRVPAVADGEVVQSGQGETYGNCVVVYHGRVWRENREYGLYTMCAHGTEALVRVGARVRAGDAVITAGNTGHTNGGVHLHFGVMLGPVDPSEWHGRPVDERGKGPTLNPRLFDWREVAT